MMQTDDNYSPNKEPNIKEVEFGKTDKAIAQELRNKFFEALKPVAELIGEAEKEGFEVGFQFGKNAFGQPAVMLINLLKKY